MKLEEKISLIKQLFDMSKADHNIDQTEVNFLYELAVSLELPLEILEDLFDEKPIYLKKQIPTSSLERITQIYRLALMLNVDKQVTFDEVHLLRNLALELKLPPDSVNIMLSEILKSQTGTLKPDKLFQIFNTTGN